MTGNKELFATLSSFEGGNVSFGGGEKGKIVGIGNIGKKPSPIIEDVYLVNGLKHNLLSISQLSDKNFDVVFKSDKCIVSLNNEVIFIALRKYNVYIFEMNELVDQKVRCLAAVDQDPWLWHKRLGHANMELISKLERKNLVRGLPTLKYVKDVICEECTKGKQTKSSFKTLNEVSTSKPLQLLHLDLFGPMRVASLGGKSFVFVIVDDFSCFTWTIFLANKSDSFIEFSHFYKRIENEKDLKIAKIRSDHGGEFENELFDEFCLNNGISHVFSAPRTPQQNGVVERKNRTIQEMARTMLNSFNLPKYFWAEAVNTACYVLNRVLIRPIFKKTPYELFYAKIPNIGYFKVFGCKCFILNTKDSRDKFDNKSDIGIFLGYSTKSKAYRVFNKRSLKVEESINVTFDESNIL